MSGDSRTPLMKKVLYLPKKSVSFLRLFIGEVVFCTLNISTIYCAHDKRQEYLAVCTCGGQPSVVKTGFRGVPTKWCACASVECDVFSCRWSHEKKANASLPLLLMWCQSRIVQFSGRVSVLWCCLHACFCSKVSSVYLSFLSFASMQAAFAITRTRSPVVISYLSKCCVENLYVCSLWLQFCISGFGQ